MENIRLLSPTGERVSLAQLCNIEERDGASEIYREGNQRYVAIKYSVRGPRPGQRGGGSHQQGQRAGATAARVSHRLGGRVPEREARRGAPVRHRAAHRPADFHHPLHHVQILQVGAADSRRRHDGAPRRSAGAVGHGHQFQRFLGRGVPGAVRRLGPDRRDHARVHQPARGCAATRSRTRRSRARCCGCAPS